MEQERELEDTDEDPVSKQEPSKPEEAITANNSEASATTSEEEMNNLDKSGSNDALEESKSVLVAENPVIVSPITAADEQTNDAMPATSEPQQPSTTAGTSKSEGREGKNDALMMPPQESKAEDDDATATTGSLTVEGINSMEDSPSEEPREETKTERNCDKSSSAPECVTSADEQDVPRDTSSKVTFATVTIREYPIILGDNPGDPGGPVVLTGAPLTIDWQHQGEVTIQVDAYETKRPKRRNPKELSIPPETRLDILRESGFSLAEIQKYTKRANLIRVSRKTTVGLSHLYPISDAKERLIRGLCNKTFRKAEKQREREFLQATLRFHHHGLLKKRESTELTEASFSSFDAEDEPVEP